MTKDDGLGLDPLTFGVWPGGLTAPGETDSKRFRSLDQIAPASSLQTLLGKPVIDERPGAGGKVVGTVTGVTSDSARLTLDEPGFVGLLNHPTIAQHPTPDSVDWGTMAAEEIMADFAAIVAGPTIGDRRDALRRAFDESILSAGISTPDSYMLKHQQYWYHGGRLTLGRDPLASGPFVPMEPPTFTLGTARLGGLTRRPWAYGIMTYPDFRVWVRPPWIRACAGWQTVGLARIRRTRSGRWRVCVATTQGGRTRAYRTKALALASVPRGPVRLTLMENRRWELGEAYDRAMVDLIVRGDSAGLRGLL